MAKHTKRVSCKFCDRRFKNAQGVRAHLKGCKTYQKRFALGNLPRELLPEEHPVHEDNQQILLSPRPRTRAQQECLRLLILVAESVDDLLQKCYGHCLHAKLTDSMARPKDDAGLNEWCGLYKAVKDCLNTCQEMIGAWDPHREGFGSLYHSLTRIKTLWMQYRMERLNRLVLGLNVPETSRSEFWEQEYHNSGIEEEETQFAKVIDQVRGLWVSA